jgi:hypothetical protein
MHDQGSLLDEDASGDALDRVVGANGSVTDACMVAA